MDSSTEEFLKKFKENQQIALDASAKIVNATVLEMYKKIIDRTPIGDPTLWKWPAHSDYTPGTLRASWQLSFNGQQRSAGGQFSSSSQTLGNGGIVFKIGSGAKTSIAISNPQPYAQRVETGWSTQAPSGMMRITIFEYSSLIDQNAAKYRVK